MDDLLEKCPICGGETFNKINVLPRELINDWKLTNEETNYMNLQQGFHCEGCKCNLRVMTLVSHMLSYYESTENFVTFMKKFENEILEINQVGDLSNFLSLSKKHVLKEYPDIDIENIFYDDESFDLIIHSDTLEHIPNSIRALNECYRVLKIGGAMFFTIPIIHDRLTIKKTGMPKSYHCNYNDKAEDFLVQTEYGANFYLELISAGFKDIRLYTVSNKASISIAVTKLKG